MTSPQTASDPSAVALAILLDGTGVGAGELVDAAAATAAGDADFADVYVERTVAESWSLDEGRIKSGDFGIDSGMSLRAVRGEASAFACADLVSGATLARIRDAAGQGLRQLAGTSRRVELAAAAADAPPRYGSDSPLALADADKIAMLRRIDDYARQRDSRIHNVTASLALAHKVVVVARSDGILHADLRPMTQLRVAVVLDDNGSIEAGSAGTGARAPATALTDDDLTGLADEAIRIAGLRLTATDAPAGMMPVVLANAWSGVLLHEAVGHGLEGDFNRKGQSAFTGKVGQRVAPRGVTVVDDGTLEKRRGSLTCDDEGTPSACNVLIEDGVLKGYMQDVVNASLMGVAPTGNGRRQSYRYAPMPRMTNTFMRAGQHTPEEIIASVDKGLYCRNFGGGSVDITNGNFNFGVEEAYVIENGRLGRHVKGATVIGNGPESMLRMSMVASDLELDPGVGTCGKNGQWVPVGVGQPHCKVDEMLVGGTQT